MIKLLIIFTSKVSLKLWAEVKILDREIKAYNKISEKLQKIIFLTYGDKSELKYLEKLNNISIFPTGDKIKKYMPFFLNTLFFPIIFYKLFKTINLIKTNQMRGSYVGWLAKIIYNKPLIIRCGYEPIKNYLLRKKNKGKSILSYWLFSNFLIEFISYKISDQIISTNIYDARFIIRHFKIDPSKITIIPNYINTKLFTPIKVQKKEKTIIFVGRLDESKNLENLIKSFTLLDNYKLDLIGAGDFLPELKQLVRRLNLKSRISFLGTYPNEKIPGILNKYHAFILPSKWEGNPKALLEAMSCGLVCIGSNIEGINNIIKHKQNGYLCELDPKSISEAIKKAFSNTDLNKKIQKTARDYVVKNNSLESIVRKEYNLYKKVVRKK